MTQLSTKINTHTLKLVLFASIVVLGFNSCYKSPKQLGAELLPENSKLNVFYSDTTTLNAYSQAIDSIRSDETSLNILGSINDPVFGKTTAGFYTQFQLSSNGHDFGKNPILDSLVLQLYYAGTFGDTTSSLLLHTYEMKDSISLNNSYYSNDIIPVYSTDYSDMEFVPHPHDSIPVYPDTIKNIIRIRLSDKSEALGNKLLHATTDDLDDNTHFQEYFKGLYLIAEPVSQNGVMLFYNLVSPFSNLTIYYKNDEQDSLKYQFLITVTAARINHFEHDFSFGNENFRQQVLGGDTLLGCQKTYTQGLGGVQTVITMPYIRDFSKLGIIGINEAILELPGFENEPFFEFPPKMTLVQRLGDDSYGVLPDQFEGENYFGGKYIASRNVYEFRITQYIQSLLLDSTEVNNGLYVFVSGGSVNPQRFIFNGPKPQNDTLNPMRLKIVYTDTD